MDATSSIHPFDAVVHQRRLLTWLDSWLKGERSCLPFLDPCFAWALGGVSLLQSLIEAQSEVESYERELPKSQMLGSRFLHPTAVRIQEFFSLHVAAVVCHSS